MEIQEIRLRNLAQLKKSIGSLRAIADKSGIDRGYLGQINTKVKTFSEKKARQIEKGCNLPYRWMDRPPAELINKDFPLHQLAEECRQLGLEHEAEIILRGVIATAQANQ